ncbi:MAG: AAA family ATPase [Deltaproteobacteria bacterium]|nr:AAA family ATPase [Deltaproteobacteria bacterium]
MQIKKLEMVGFKSFVDPTIIDFDSPLIGIVGPNGCGKSNIVDAIRWVMGEMSAKSLRGRGMEDVIFNGSQTRPPINMAEVSLTFSTEDGIAPAPYTEFSEITITRRLFRDGESEYLINKIPCRLRDIINLFLGTGVGHRAYSVIEQGRIDFAINAKPEDRRLLIEEAAGVSKFKARKEAAVRKMEATRQNLARLKDILVEVQRQIGSLDRQVKKAEKYRQLKEEVKSLDLKLASLRYREANTEKGELESLLSDWNRRELESQTRISALDASQESARLQLLEKDRELNRRQEALFEATSRLKLLQAKEEFQLREKKRLEEEKASSTQILQEGEKIRQEVGRIAQQLEILRSDSSSVHHEMEELRARIASGKERKEVLEKELAIRREEISLKRSRFKSLVDLERNFEGYQEGVRNILRAKREGSTSSGVLGVVADYVDSPQEYEMAVSAALGEKLQYVIVKSHEEGLEAVSFLKSQASGRSTFIALDIREKEENPFPYQESGVIGPLLDLVKLKADTLKVGQYLLGDVILVQNLDKAIDLWRSNGHHKTLVTLEGEVVDPFGVVSGGSAGLPGKMLLEKKREIRELRIEVARLEEEISLKEDSVSQFEGTLSELSLDLEDLNRRKHEEDIKKISLDKEGEHLTKELKRLQEVEEALRRAEEKINRLQEEKESEQAERAVLQGKVEALTLSADQIRKEHQAISRTLEEEEARTRTLRKEYDLARSHTGDLRVTLSRLEGDLRHMGEQIFEKYNTSLTEVAFGEEAVPIDRSLEEKNLSELKARLEKLGDVNLGAIPEYEALRERQEFLGRQTEDLEQSLLALEKAIQKINQMTRKRFEETFVLVNEKFKALFPRLFRGGSAELRLTESEDGASQGMDLFVQPPGKKLSHIGLLSGGEKAMSAVAFIFSIFLVKPSPFCILDEVDAPLDDTNVERFHKLLSEILPRSQFILITHNRRTMEQCHRLYGVTMEEAGISKIVSVRLAEALPLAS